MSIQRNILQAGWEERDGKRVYHAVWNLCEAGKEVLAVEELAEEKNVRMELKGPLRSDTQHFFKDELLALATADCDLVIDCRNLSSISNACQIGLIETQQLMDAIGRGTLTLTGLPEPILADFRATGVAGSLAIE